MSRKMIISLVLGFILLVGAVILFANYKSGVDEGAKHVKKEQKEREKETEVVKGNYAEHYGIDENLLTYEEMSDAVTKIESEYEEDIKGMDNSEKSRFIKEIIKEDYGKWNASAYSRGILIKDGMSESDKQQVVAALMGNMTYKKLVNPINYAYQVEEENDYVKQKDLVYNFMGDVVTSNLLIGDTGGFYTYGNVHFGYPVLLSVVHKDRLGLGVETFEDDGYVAYVGITGLNTEDMKLEDAVKEKIKQYDMEINGRKYIDYFTEEVVEEGTKYYEGKDEEDSYIEDNHDYGGGLLPKNTFEHFDLVVALPVKEVFENEKGSGEDIAEKFHKGELTTGKINLGGKEIELVPIEDEYISPEIKGELGSK